MSFSSTCTATVESWFLKVSQVIKENQGYFPAKTTQACTNSCWSANADLVHFKKILMYMQSI